MRIHTDRIDDPQIIRQAVLDHLPGCFTHNLTQHNSRSRRRAFEFNLSGHGITGGQWGSYPYKTATWDEWGILIGTLYVHDPLAHWGNNSYQNAEHFHWSTADRYRHLLAANQCLRHRWKGQGKVVGGHYYVAECERTDCSAVRRWLAPGWTWKMFVAAGA